MVGSRRSSIGSMSPTSVGRDLDSGEKRIVHEEGLRENFFTMTDVDRLGMAHCIEKAIEIAGAAPGGFAVTFDVDVI